MSLLLKGPPFVFLAASVLHFLVPVISNQKNLNKGEQKGGAEGRMQAKNGCKLRVIKLIINSGHKKQLAYSQGQITQAIYYKR